MAFTQIQFDALQAAYAEGVTRVTFNGRTVEYRSLSEMKSILREMENSLQSKTKYTSVNPVTAKGI